MHILPYHPASKSVKLLKTALACKSLRLEDSVFVLKPDSKILNWGRISLTSPLLGLSFSDKRMLNRIPAIKIASDKLRFFNKVRTVVNVPDYSTSYVDALDWVVQGDLVLARTKKGSRGDGIKFSDTDLGLFPQNNFFVRYKKSSAEFRVHVFRGRIIHLTKKVWPYDKDKSQANWRIRNHQNGFKFILNGFDVPLCVEEAALTATKAVGLDFAALDILWNKYENKAYVLEANTAPGLEAPSTLEAYVKAIKEWRDEETSQGETNT